jgi:hypothetical protein
MVNTTATTWGEGQIAEASNLYRAPYSRYSHKLDGRGSIPGRGREFLYSIASRPALGPTQPHIQCIPGERVKRQGREAEHSPASDTEVKKDGAIPQLPLRLHGVALN